MRHRLSLFLLGPALLALAVGGCGPRVVKVNGKILENGSPLVVSADTYVTLSFLPSDEGKSDATRTSYNAKFDQSTGKYSVELPPGKYRTMLIVVPPNPKSGGKLSAPPKPVKSDRTFDLTRNQDLDIEKPAK